MFTLLHLSSGLRLGDDRQKKGVRPNSSGLLSRSISSVEALCSEIDFDRLML